MIGKPWSFRLTTRSLRIFGLPTSSTLFVFTLRIWYEFEERTLMLTNCFNICILSRFNKTMPYWSKQTTQMIIHFNRLIITLRLGLVYMMYWTVYDMMCWAVLAFYLESSLELLRTDITMLSYFILIECWVLRFKYEIWKPKFKIFQL